MDTSVRQCIKGIGGLIMQLYGLSPILPKGAIWPCICTWCLLLVYLVFPSEIAIAQSSPSPPDGLLSDTQKEAVAAIREITLQLILLSVGVFTLTGIFLPKTKNRTAFGMAMVAFGFFAASVFCGILAYSRLIQSLNDSDMAFANRVGEIAVYQWILFGVGGLILMVSFLWGTHSQNQSE
jgi:hypothetical protein